MKKNYCIIGTGRQGRAAAYDLLKFAPISELLLLDNSQKSIELCLEKIKPVVDSVSIKHSLIDFNDIPNLVKLLSSSDIFLSSVPYKYNLLLTDVAVESKTSMVDLGGHTGNVIKQLKFDEVAKEKNITIVPDCGMGPGMNITMALFAMEHFDEALEVRIWDGGLPKFPKEPWNYSLFFNIAGLTNEYDASAFFLKDSEINEVPCFKGYEILDFGEKIGKLEAAITSGGLSTMPWTYEGKLDVLENKTLRYLGHWEWMKAYRELGLFGEQKINYKGQKISPRDFYHFLLEPKLDTRDFNDICLMRIEAIGIKDGDRRTITVNAVEEYDDQTKLMPMEKWTGWHASIMMQHIASGNIGSGAFPVENALTGHQFYEQAMKRNYKIKIEEE